MPILLRIVARQAIAIGLSILAFVGIEPNVEIQPRDVQQQATEERKELVQETIQGKASTTVATIPLPSLNILEELPVRVAINVPTTPNETRPTDVSSHPPVVDQVPTQTKPPVTTVAPNIPDISITITPQSEPPAPEDTDNEPATDTTKTQPTPSQQAADTTAPSTIENAVMSIACVMRNGNAIHLTNGSAVLISPKGVVLTNAHVAQMFLLDERGYDCTLHRENIPTYGFRAEPLYISESWIEDNARNINNPSPTGTGEDDYALLLITANTNPALSLPNRFPYIEPNTETEPVEIGDSVITAAYPGIQSASLDIAKNTKLRTDKTTVKNVFTFARTTVDVFATNDTSVAKRGSSGGGVFKENKLVGLIVTTNPGSTPTTLILNALTLDYIDRDLRAETGTSLASWLSGDVQDQAQSFQTSAVPRLKELLLQHL